MKLWASEIPRDSSVSSSACSLFTPFKYGHLIAINAITTFKQTKKTKKNKREAQTFVLVSLNSLPTLKTLAEKGMMALRRDFPCTTILAHNIPKRMHWKIIFNDSLWVSPMSSSRHSLCSLAEHFIFVFPSHTQTCHKDSWSRQWRWCPLCLRLAKGILNYWTVGSFFCLPESSRRSQLENFQGTSHSTKKTKDRSTSLGYINLHPAQVKYRIEYWASMSKLTAKVMYCQTIWPHRVVPFLADFLKDIVESVNLLDSLLRFSVQSNQNKLFDSYRAGKRT